MVNDTGSKECTSRRRYLKVAGAVGVVSTAGCLGVLTGPSVEKVKEDAETIEYESLYRNISDYKGDYVHYPQVRITDVVSGQGTKEYLMALPGGGWVDSKILYGKWGGDPFREDDSVEIWGVVKGLYSYTSMVGKQTVPKLKLVEMELL